MDKAIKTIFFFVAVVILIVTAGNFYMGGLLSPQGGVFVSNDKGVTWQRYGNMADGSNISRLDTTELENNPKDSRILYLGTLGNGVFKSVDNGANWHKLADVSGVLSSRASIYSIAIDPNFPDYSKKIPDKFYLGVSQDGYGAILKTEDGGVSFKTVYISPAASSVVYAVKINPSKTNVVWAGTSDGLLLKSQDRGETWKLIQEFGASISSIILNPSSTSRMFVGTFSRGVFSSADGGASWVDESESLNSYPNSKYIERVILDPWGNLYLASRFGLLKSSNWGLSWKPVNIVFPDGTLPVLDVAFGQSQNEIYVSDSNLVFNTKDGGEFWQIRKLGTTHKIRSLWIDPASGVILAAAGKTNIR